MDTYFFHNRHDSESREALKTLPDNAVVFDVFGGDEIPRDYKLCFLPYLVDKELVLVTPGPYPYAEEPLTLQWECRDSQGNKLKEDPRFFITVDGETMDESAVDGVLEIDVMLNSTSMKIKILNETDGYHPWIGTIEVVMSE